MNMKNFIKFAIFKALIFLPAVVFGNGEVTVINKIIPQNGAFTGIVDSSQAVNQAQYFTRNLSTSDTNVQHALQTLDQLTVTTSSSTLPPGSSNYLQNNQTSTVQSATGFISSMTVQGPSTVSDSSTGNYMRQFFPSSGPDTYTTYNAVTPAGGGHGFTMAVSTADATQTILGNSGPNMAGFSAIGGATPSLSININNGRTPYFYGQTIDFPNLSGPIHVACSAGDPCLNWYASSMTFSGSTFAFTSTLNIASTTFLNGTPGTAGQLFMTNGNGTAPSYYTLAVSSLVAGTNITFSYAGTTLTINDTASSGSGITGITASTGTQSGFTSVFSTNVTNLNLNSTQFSGTLTNTTFYFLANNSTFTLQGNTFNAAGKLVQSDASNFYPALAGFNSALNMNTHLINNVTDPSAAQDAATKNYVDTQVSGSDWKAACVYASTAALPVNIYANGSSGVGATLTGVALAGLSVDGYAVVLGQRILVKNEVASANNGIYTVTATGSGIAVYILTRATDFNSTTNITAGDATFISSGTVNIDTGWVMVTAGTITVGTTAIVFNQNAGPGTYSATAPLTLTGTAFGVDKTSVTVQGVIIGSTNISVTNGAGTATVAITGMIPGSNLGGGSTSYANTTTTLQTGLSTVFLASGTVNNLNGSTITATTALIHPFSAAPVMSTGAAAIDTTADQLLYMSTPGVTRVLYYKQHTGVYISSVAMVTTDATSTHTFFSPGYPVTFTDVWCHFDGVGTTPATFGIYHGSSNTLMTYGTLTCSSNTTNVSPVAITANGSVTTGESVGWRVTNTPTASDDYLLMFDYTVDNR